MKDAFFIKSSDGNCFRLRCYILVHVLPYSLSKVTKSSHFRATHATSSCPAKCSWMCTWICGWMSCDGWHIVVYNMLPSCETAIWWRSISFYILMYCFLSSISIFISNRFYSSLFNPVFASSMSQHICFKKLKHFRSYFLTRVYSQWKWAQFLLSS